MENMKNSELMVMEDVAQISDMNMLASAMSGDATAFVTSIKDDGSREKKIAIYNAVNKSGEKIDDHKGEILEIENFAAHPVQLASDETGEITDVLRIVLIDKNGVCFETVSKGVMSSLVKIFSIVGVAPWTPALKIRPVEVKTRKGFKVLTLELAE